MQSNNPVFARNDNFNGKGGYASFEAPAYGGPVTHTGAGTGRMTIDTVVQKTAMTLGVVVIAAGLTWVLTGDVFDSRNVPNDDVIQRLYVLSIVGGLGGFALSLVNSFKRVVNPALVIAYAAFQGVAVGALSKAIESAYDGGVVIGAVLGTVAAVGGTLAAYKFFDIKVNDKFRTFVIAAMFGFVAVTMLDFVLSLFKADIGFNGFSGLGLVMSVVGLGIGILMLILDFDFVERGIAGGLPERESWRAAFGLTVTIVWIYIQLLRLLAIVTRR
jgi:uncharacterized YccA/Bax inhibitor family protein